MPQDIISLRTAKAKLSQLVKRAAAGEVVYIGAEGRAEVKLVAAGACERPARRIGILKGKLQVPDDLDAVIPDDLLREFEGDV